jgi:MFS family permease
MQLLIVLLGLIVLVYGRRLFWLFIAIAGFLVGVEISHVLLANQPQWVILVCGFAAGLFGALLSILIERLAFVLAGFYAGAYLILFLSHSWGFMGKDILLFFMGGVIGAVFSGLLMNWAIILLSSLVGAGAIVGQLELDQTFRTIVFVVLVMIGTFTQARKHGYDGADGK